MNDIETMLSDSANRIFDNEVTMALVDGAEQGQWPAQLWSCLEDNGLTRVFAPEDDGGAGASWIEALPVLLAASRTLAPVPFIETAVAGAVLRQTGLSMPAGPLSLALPQGEVRIDPEGDDWIFSGEVDAPWGRFLSHALVPVAHQEATLWLLLPTLNMQIRHDINAAGQPRDTLTFHRARARAAGSGWLGDPRLIGALQQSIQIAGVLERILNQSVQYANDRTQFGRPIGKFQAIQQQLAVLANQAVAARMAVSTACAAMATADWEQAAVIAKIICGQAASVVAGIAHQVHGAIGFTYEHSLHFSTRRLWCWRAEYGSDGEWAQRLGRKAIARGGQALWPNVTAHDGEYSNVSKAETAIL